MMYMMRAIVIVVALLIAGLVESERTVTTVQHKEKQDARNVPAGYVMYWFYRKSSQPDSDLKQGGGTPGETPRIIEVAKLIRSQSEKSGNPLTERQLVELLPKVAALAYIVHQDSESVVSSAALEGFLGTYPYNTAEMGLLATHPNHTGQGLGGIVTTQLSDVGYDVCELTSFFSITKVTNYLSLKAQFFSGMKGVVQRYKGVSTVVGYATSSDIPPVIYVVMLSPTGVYSVLGMMHTLDAQQNTTCGALALNEVIRPNYINNPKVEETAISWSTLQSQFVHFPDETTDTMARVHSKEQISLPGVIARVADWLGIIENEDEKRLRLLSQAHARVAHARVAAQVSEYPDILPSHTFP